MEQWRVINLGHGILVIFFYNCIASWSPFFVFSVNLTIPVYPPPRRTPLQHNPEKLGTVEEALARYKGREDVLFQRLKKQYGMPIPA